MGLAQTIVAALGGEENIETVTNCYSRLRLTLTDPEKVNEGILKNETGASGIIRKGQNVQVVYGLQVNAIRKSVDTVLNRATVEE